MVYLHALNIMQYYVLDSPVALSIVVQFVALLLLPFLQLYVQYIISHKIYHSIVNRASSAPT